MFVWVSGDEAGRCRMRALSAAEPGLGIADGWATLFSAVHVCLGDLYLDGIETLLARHRKDPLTKALRSFDLRLLALYAEVRDDLEQRIASATGPHHLFHVITEEAAVRLHMTRRLIDEVES